MEKKPPPVRVEMSEVLFYPNLWLGYGIVVTILLVLLKVLERARTMPAGSTFSEIVLSGIRGRVTNVSFAVFVTSVVFVFLVARSMQCLLALIKPSNVVLEFRRGILAWIVLSLLSWVLYFASIAIAPDKGTFLKMTLDLPIRVYQSIEGTLDLIALAVTFGFLVLAMGITSKLSLLTETEQNRVEIKQTAVRYLRWGVASPLTVYGVLGIIFLAVGIDSMVDGFSRGNYYAGVVLTTAVLYVSVFGSLWWQLRRKFPPKRLKGKRHDVDKPEE